MGKRSNFERKPRDAYQTIDERAFPPLLPFLGEIRAYAEPCMGDGFLISGLKKFAPEIGNSYANDIVFGECAITGNTLPQKRWLYDAIITNPPWSKKLLHPMIERFASIAPTWLLFYSDWAFTLQAAPYLEYCRHIVPTPRLQWEPGSEYSAMDNTAWYFFDKKDPGTTVLHPRAKA